MNGRLGASASNNELRMALVAIAFILGLAFLFRPERPAPVGPRPPEYRTDPDQGAKRVDQLAAEVSGDFEKLQPDDQRWLDSMTAGHGADLIRSRAKVLGIRVSKHAVSRRPPASVRKLPGTSEVSSGQSATP